MTPTREPEDGEPHETLRVVRRRALADEWALVLVAEGLHARIRGGPEGFALEVPASERAVAERALASFERENEPAPVIPPPPILDRFAFRHALGVALALFASYALTGPDGGPFADAGRAEAAAIRGGAWWRTITALGLHADAGHVLGNAIVGALFAFAVFQNVGAGVGLLLAVAAGAFGNAANAALRESAHATIGASTAVFGALGLLVGHAIVGRRASSRRQAIWVPLGAGLALLAMLGTEGERVDLWAHGLGLAAGVVLGVGAALAPVRWLAHTSVQVIAAAAAIAAVVAAWRAALAP